MTSKGTLQWLNSEAKDHVPTFSFSFPNCKKMQGLMEDWEAGGGGWGGSLKNREEKPRWSDLDFLKFTAASVASASAIIF